MSRTTAPSSDILVKRSSKLSVLFPSSPSNRSSMVKDSCVARNVQHVGCFKQGIEQTGLFLRAWTNG